MTFAIKEINKRSDFLSNITLGFHIRDSCDDIPVSLRATLQLVNGQPESNLPSESIRGNLSIETTTNLGCAAVDRRVSSVIIGDAGSGVSMALLRSLGSFHIPLVRLSDCFVGKRVSDSLIPSNLQISCHRKCIMALHAI